MAADGVGISGGDDKKVNLFRTANGELLGTFSSYSGFTVGVDLVKCSPCGRYVVGCSDNELVLLRREEDGSVKVLTKLLRKAFGRKTYIISFEVFWGEEYLVVGTEDGAVYSVEIEA